MNRLELLLTTVGEEACEVGQMASKLKRFGLKDIFPGQPFTNAERMHQEIDDLMAAIDLLNKEFDLGYIRCEQRIKTKIEKINNYAEYSKKLGTLK